MTVVTTVEGTSLMYEFYTTSGEVVLEIVHDWTDSHQVTSVVTSVETTTGDDLSNEDKELVRSAIVRLLNTLRTYRSVQVNWEVFKQFLL